MSGKYGPNTAEQELFCAIRACAFTVLRDLVPDTCRAVDKAYRAADTFGRELVWEGEVVPTLEQVQAALAIMRLKGINGLGYARAILERRGHYKPRVRIKEHGRSVASCELQDPFAEEKE